MNKDISEHLHLILIQPVSQTTSQLSPAIHVFCSDQNATNYNPIFCHSTENTMQGQVSFYNHNVNVGQDGKADVCRRKRSIIHRVEREQCVLPNPSSRQVAEIKKIKTKPSALGARVYNGCS